MLSYERIEKIQNVTVGIFVILGLLALGWLIFKFNDLPSAISRINSYQVSVQFESAPGVQKDTPVRFCGFQIGRVTDVLSPQIRDELKNGQKTGRRFYQTLVIISINKQYKMIPSNAKVQLASRGLGSSFIELVTDPNQVLEVPDVNMLPPGTFLADGMVLQGHVGTGSELIPAETQEKLDKLISGLIVAVNNTNEIIGDANNKENLKASLVNLNKATAEATASIKEFQAFMASTNKSSEELSKIMAAIRQIVEKVETGEGTLGKVVTDGRFYESLLENSRQLKEVLKEMQEFIERLKEKGVKVQL